MPSQVAIKKTFVYIEHTSKWLLLILIYDFFKYIWCSISEQQFLYYLK